MIEFQSNPSRELFLCIAVGALAACNPVARESDVEGERFDRELEDKHITARLASLESEHEKLKARVSELEGELETRERLTPQSVAATPTPGAYLTVGDREPRPQVNMEACEAARESVLRQFAQQCRASGAVYCADPRVICTPN